MKKYNCIIIGAGSIGALKPDNIDSPTSVNILTHAHAVKYIEELNLITIIDPDMGKVSELYTKWNAYVHLNISDFFKSTDLHIPDDYNIDIVTVASPTETHLDVIKEVVEKIKPKIIICEKPFCNTLEDAEQAIKLCKSNNIKLIVHYNRRYCNLYAMAKSIYNEQYGKVLSCSLTYTRGLKRDGCHAIDLFNLMFGEFLNGNIIPVPYIAGQEAPPQYNYINDYSADDLTYPVYLQYEKCPNVFMVPHDGRFFSVFDFKILTEHAEILITNHGADVIINYATKEKVYGNFYSLDYFDERKIYKMHMKNSLINIYSECISYLNAWDEKEFQFSSPATDAIKVHKIFRHLGV